MEGFWTANREQGPGGSPMSTIAQGYTENSLLPPHPSLPAGFQAHKRALTHTHTHTHTYSMSIEPVSESLLQLSLFAWNAFPFQPSKPTFSRDLHTPGSSISSVISPGQTDLMIPLALPYPDRNCPRATDPTPSLSTSSLTTCCDTHNPCT